MDRLNVTFIIVLLLFLYRMLSLQVRHWDFGSFGRWLPSGLRPYLMYYTVFYAVLSGVAFDSLQTTVRLFREHPRLDEATYRWGKAMDQNMPLRERGCPKWLRYVSLGTPFAVVGTLIVCGCHTLRHASTVQNPGHVSILLQRDRVIQVIALPVIYALVAYNAVIQLWCLLTGYETPQSHFQWVNQTLVGSSWEDMEADTSQIYIAYHATGTLYEAYAMLIFVRLLLEEIEATIQLTMRGEADDIRPQHQSLVDVLHSLTMQGVYWFVFTCFLDASYNVIIGNIKRYTEIELPEECEKIEHYLYGMGFITSSAAITNVISVETSLHRYLEDFRAEKKFLSVKIMVTLAFMQSLLMNLFAAYFTETQSRLLYSSMLCYEVFFLALFHINAWQLNEPWLNNLQKRQRQAEKGSTDLSSDSGSDSDEDTAVESLALTQVVHSD